MLKAGEEPFRKGDAQTLIRSPLAGYALCIRDCVREPAVPLSEYESRVLERLEQEFTITDPELSRWLTNGVAALPPSVADRRTRRVLGGFAGLRNSRAHSIPPLVTCAILLMVLGAVLVGVAAINGWFVVLGVAAAAYLGGLVPLIVWNRRRTS